MYKKTITYTDFNDNVRTEDFYFHFTKAELAEMEMSVTGGLKAMVDKIVQAQNQPELVKIFKDLILKAYGEKSPDGRRFIKNDQLREEFSQTEAYSILFMELASDDNAASEFVNGLLPADMREEVAREMEKMENPALPLNA